MRCFSGLCSPASGRYAQAIGTLQLTESDLTHQTYPWQGFPLEMQSHSSSCYTPSGQYPWLQIMQLCMTFLKVHPLLHIDRVALHSLPVSEFSDVSLVTSAESAVVGLLHLLICQHHSKDQCGVNTWGDLHDVIISVEVIGKEVLQWGNLSTPLSASAIIIVIDVWSGSDLSIFELQYVERIK